MDHEEKSNPPINPLADSKPHLLPAHHRRLTHQIDELPVPPADRTAVLGLAAFISLAFFYFGFFLQGSSLIWPRTTISNVCPQQPPYSSDLEPIQLPSPSNLSLALSGAVQIDTSVYDGWPTVAEDPMRWNQVFAPFRDYLELAFPLVHAQGSGIRKELVNENGLLFTWQGRNKSLKPVLFMAHQDVVPVDVTTLDQWVHPPFSGFIDEELGLVWGRGASDTKSSLVSILASLEALLAFGFENERTLIASFGFDEESAGTEGGGKLAQHLEHIYGEDGIAMIVDEGGTVVRANDPENGGLGIPVAAPAVGEKGYLDARITVRTPGGHSSMPRPHTSIGYLAKLITAIETNPYRPILRLDGNPALNFLQCVRDAPYIDKKLSKALRELEKTKHSLEMAGKTFLRALLPRRWSREAELEKVKEKVLKLLDQDQQVPFLTTQAVDLISGGVKVNALPEEATAVINHRIEPGSSVQAVRDHIFHTVLALAEANRLSIDGWSNSSLQFTPSSGFQQKMNGEIVLSDAFDSALEPAPNTPLGDAKPWKLLSSIIRKTWRVKSAGGTEEGILVAPDLMGGNTDCKSYYRLSKHVFRFSPSSLEENRGPSGGSGIHTVNENEQIDTLVKGVEFYTELMRAVSSQELE
ncbi:carboxypeptidase S [Violaceomyces palustris]|uniref:Carboxypeptidase S n=1 Tax=Violaceomyces palustris TaxID=1673888 RepID=A0ACD0NTV7_9BASI|nr:carboxypeptidase S [Violaceomyces palustris]